MPSDKNGIFAPIKMPTNCYYCPFMRERLFYMECFIDGFHIEYSHDRSETHEMQRPELCPLLIVNNGMVNNVKGEK